MALSPRDKEPELRRILDQATRQVTNYTINHDIKSHDRHAACP